jgi:hypothetical protein
MTAWLLMPGLMLLLAVIFVTYFSPVISWALGEGTPGFFVARDVDCHHGCHWFGEFLSPDHAVALRNIQYAGNAPAIKAGAVIPVVHVDSALFSNIAYPRHATLRDLLWVSVWPALVLALLLFLMFVRWVWTVPVRYWRRR